MYSAIVETYGKAAKAAGIDIIIPSGTAIQNGRTSSIGDRFCRDGFHLNRKTGRFTAACTWYEKLTGKSVLSNTFVPDGLSDSEVEIARHAAHYAIEQPDRVTLMSNF
jgi:hypothetical protein